MTITFEVVTSAGVQMREEGLDRVVVRRREQGFESGSEVAIYPRHGPLLMQTQACRARLTRGGSTREFDVAAGIVEALEDHVTLIVT